MWYFTAGRSFTRPRARAPWSALEVVTDAGDVGITSIPWSRTSRTFPKRRVRLLRGTGHDCRQPRVAVRAAPFTGGLLDGVHRAAQRRALTFLTAASDPCAPAG